MKIAVIGDGPIALRQAVKINELGGHAVWFDTHPESLEYLSKQFPLNDQDLKHLLQDKEDLIKSRQYSNDVLLRVTKKFLLPGEEILKASRFTDLFRVVVLRKTAENLIEDDQKISPEILSNLKEEIEVYFDFDVILDCQSGFHNQQFIGVKSPVVGELYPEAQKRIVYGSSILDASIAELTEVLLVGESSVGAQFILTNEEYIKKTKNLFFWSSSKPNPISTLIENANSNQKDQLTNLFNWVNKDYDEQKTEYKKKYQEWNELEDYMKAKISEPAYPIPRVIIFAGHTVTAVNKLIDQDKIYISIEKPHFRQVEIQVENAELLSKTLSVDSVFSASDFFRQTSFYQALTFDGAVGNQKEIGLYFFPLINELTSDKLKNEEDIFTKQLLKWFSPAESH